MINILKKETYERETHIYEKLLISQIMLLQHFYICLLTGVIGNFFHAQRKHQVDEPFSIKSEKFSIKIFAIF